MLVSIQKFIENNYPEVKIISAEEIVPNIRDIDSETPHLKFYDVTFEYKGKTFTKLFHDRLKETIDEQFQEAVRRSNIFPTLSNP